MSTKTIVPTFKRVDGDDPESDVNQWIKSIPDNFTAEQAATAAASALTDANKRIDAVRDQYKGTIPPAPWPATPEVRKAIDTMNGGRDYFNEMEKTRPTATWAKTSKAWIALSSAGTNLYGALDELEHKSANAPALRDMLNLVPDPRDLILGRFPKRDVAIAAGLAYVLFPQVKRFIRRTLGFRTARRAR